MKDSSIPFTLQPPTTPVSNAQFLQAVCPQLPPDTYLWTAGFHGDPDQAGRSEWIGFPVQATFAPGGVVQEYQTVEDAALNSYFVVSYFKQGEGVRPSRSKASFGGLHVLTIDDIGNGLGGKIPWDRLTGHLAPSYILETSPGSFHVGYILRSPVLDRSMAEAMLKAMVYQALGLTEDPGMLSVTRYLRMPVGINGKPKYGMGGGFPCKLIHWAPERKYEAYEILIDFGLDLGVYQSEGGVGGGRGIYIESVADDPWYEAVVATGLCKGGVEAKGVGDTAEQWQDMTCPWVDDHTGGVDNGTAYSPTRQTFKCHHGHCQQKTFVDFRDWMMEGKGGTAAQRIADRVYLEERFGPIDGSALAQAEAELGLKATLGLPGGVALDRGVVGVPGAQGLAEVRWEGYGASEVLDDCHRLLEDDADRTAANAVLEKIACSPRLTSLELDDIATELGKRIGKTAPKTLKLMTEARAKWRAAESLRKNKEASAKAVQERSDIPVPFVKAFEFVSPEETPRAVEANIERLLTTAGVFVWYNEMRDQVEVGFDGGTAYPAVANLNRLVPVVRDWAEINGIKTTVALTGGHLKSIGRRYSRHPFQEYLMHDCPPWDGVDRLRGSGGLFSTVHVESGAESYRDMALERWCYSIIAAAHHLYKDRPGKQPRSVLVFSGQQYAGKTTWLQRLFSGLFPGSGDCFAGGMHYTGSTDSKRMVQRQLVTELGEIDASTRGDASLLKAFLSNDKDSFRKPFDYDLEDMERRTVFCGTVNTEFLKDKSGNSRFLTLAVKSLNLDAQRHMDMHQLWAQVNQECLVDWAEDRERHMPTEGASPWHLNDAERVAVDQRNTPHEVLNEVEEWLVDTFDFENGDWAASRNSGGHQTDPVNAATLKNLQQDYKQEMGGGKVAQGTWRVALRKLTGQQDSTKSTLTFQSLGGTSYVERGRWWFMPPRRDGRPSYREVVKLAKEEQAQAAARGVH